MLEDFLSDLTGVSEWDSLRFSLLPGDVPKGYLQPIRYISQGNSPLRVVRYMGVVAFSDVDLEGLFGQVETISNQLMSLSRAGCFSGGSVQLVGDITVEIPDGYSTGSIQTASNGFKTSISFELEVTK